MRPFVDACRNPLLCLLATTAVALTTAALRGDEPPHVAAKPTICLDLVGGGRVVGEPTAQDLQIQAESGRLTIPWANVERVLPGLSNRPELLKPILADIEQLGDASFEIRERAQRALLARGPRQRLILEEFKDDGDFERRNRVRKLLQGLDSGDADGPPWLRQDAVVTAGERRLGKLDPQSVELKTRFGLLCAPLAQVESAAPPLDTAKVDLLAKIDLARNVVSGAWSRDGAALVSPIQNRARLQVPIVPPDNYDLRLTVVAKKAARAGRAIPPDSLFVTLIVAGRQCNAALNAFGDIGGPFSGMDVVDGHRVHDLPLDRGAVMVLNQEARIAISVRGSTVKVELNDRRLFRWSGDPARLSVDKSWRLKDGRYLGLGEHQTQFRISRFELLPYDVPKPPAKLAREEVVLRLADGSLLPAKIDVGQAMIVQVGGAERKISADSLTAIRPEPNNKGLRIALSSGESFVVTALPRQAIHLTTRFGKLAPPLDGIKTLERTSQ